MISENFLKRLTSTILILPVIIFVVHQEYYYLLIFLLLTFFFSLKEWIKINNNFNFKFFGFFLIFISHLSAFLIRNYTESDMTNIHLFMIILITCISTDIGGYIFGKIIKGPKITKISPNKTYAGLMGGYILSFFFIYAYKTAYNYSYDFNLIFFILFISISSQVGDILMSFIKRRYNLKDTGTLIPGHGGILDRIDGMILAFPLSFIYLHFII